MKKKWRLVRSCVCQTTRLDCSVSSCIIGWPVGRYSLNMKWEIYFSPRSMLVCVYTVWVRFPLVLLLLLVWIVPKRSDLRTWQNTQNTQTKWQILALIPVCRVAIGRSLTVQWHVSTICQPLELLAVDCSCLILYRFLVTRLHISLLDLGIRKKREKLNTLFILNSYSPLVSQGYIMDTLRRSWVTWCRELNQRDISKNFNHVPPRLSFYSLFSCVSFWSLFSLSLSSSSPFFFCLVLSVANAISRLCRRCRFRQNPLRHLFEQTRTGLGTAGTDETIQENQF